MPDLGYERELPTRLRRLRYAFGSLTVVSSVTCRFCYAKKDLLKHILENNVPNVLVNKNFHLLLHTTYHTISSYYLHVIYRRVVLLKAHIACAQIIEFRSKKVGNHRQTVTFSRFVGHS